MKVPRRLTGVIVSAGLALMMAACGSSADANPATPTNPAPTASATTGGADGGPQSSPSPSESAFIAPTPPPTDSNTPIERYQSAVESNNVAGGYDVNATKAYIDSMVQHGDTIWTNWFEANGLQEPWVGYTIIMPGQQAASKCFQNPIPSNHPNAYHCPADYNGVDNGYLFFPVETFAKMWQGNIFDRQVADLKWTGDFAAAVIVAHELGHEIQAELAEQYNKPGPGKPNSELIADCFAGVWTYALHLDQRLETGDIDEAIKALNAIGDNTGSHGTSVERENAYRIGLYGSEKYPTPGAPWNCTVAYWPELYN
jgi:predicted metalloprotease